MNKNRLTKGCIPNEKENGKVNKDLQMIISFFICFVMTSSKKNKIHIKVYYINFLLY